MGYKELYSFDSLALHVYTFIIVTLKLFLGNDYTMHYQFWKGNYSGAEFGRFQNLI